MAATKPSAAKNKAAQKKTSTTRKTTATKATAVKKPTRAPAHKTSANKKTSAKEPVRSFRLSRETENFISMRITRQTVYWTILAGVLLVVGLLILQSQLSILETLNQISEGV